ncbi:major facilitator superfamily domain-containing protein [Sphaerosporella brunnea]|uniref:Major facilitator superfamily domain-containing protein n=1 Tax=Sphaerosporella brunnea TaxID=1250544 RepID=A0A5J5F4T0_9PEZI|nr:major facilitator superfamily domain-containing protein [Sphaerosporella brunnea]
MTMMRSSFDSYSLSEKGLKNSPSTQQLVRRTRDDDEASSYDEAVVRVTSTELTDPEKAAHLRAIRALSILRTARTPEDPQAVIDTEFEVRWSEGDLEFPMNWSLAKRGWILAVVALQTLIVIFYSTSYVSGARGMMKDFGIKSETTIILGMTTYLLGLASGPLLLAPLSELYGRRIIYLISLFLFFMLVLPACVAKNFETILITRFFAAFAGSVTISNTPGTLGDIFPEEYRTLAFSLYWYFPIPSFGLEAPMNGPVLGPIIGGFVYQNLGWRWNTWLVLILAGFFAILGITVPETYAPELLRRRAAKLRKETGDERYVSRFCFKNIEGSLLERIKLNMKRPVVMLFTEPICIFWAIYVAAIYGILYLCFTAYPIVFTQIRGWGPGLSGLAFLGIGVGTTLAVAIEPLSRKIYNLHSVDPETGKRPPEARILIIAISAIIIPLSLLCFAWTCVPRHIHWIWPILAGIPYGLGNTIVFLHANTYLVTSYDVYAASAMAGNAVVRSILGGVMPLFGPIMYRRLGPNWAATTVALIAAALIPIPWAFYKWGKKIRVRSPILQKLQKERTERGE